jgi:hypothetical protein
MKSLVLFLSVILSYAVHSDDQKTVDDFYTKHTPATYKIYCRSLISTPECRTFITFTNNLTGEKSNAFQIAFNAHTRPAAVTELFIPVTPSSLTSSGSGTYRSYLDTTHNGKFTINKATNIAVTKYRTITTIEGLAFGTLSFGKNMSTVTLKDGNEINYNRFKK